MQTQSTITTTDSSTTTEPNPYQTPVKKSPVGASANASNQAPRVNQNITPQAMDTKTQEEEFLDRIFSRENVSNQKNLSYNNGLYLREFERTLSVKRRFVKFDDKIDKKFPFLRYTIDDLKKLLNDANEVNKIPFSKDDDVIQHQREMLLQITNADGSRTPPIDNLQTVMETITPGMEVPSTPQTNLQKTADSIVQTPRKTFCRQLFPSTKDMQQFGTTTNELIPTPTQIVEGTSVKRKFSYLCNTIESSSASSSSTEKDFRSPFDTETRVFFRFVIGSSIAEHTLFSIGHNDEWMSHGQLAAKKESTAVSCNAAGIICFEKSDGKWFIKAVSNKTGHFKCGLESFLTTIGMLFTEFSSYLREDITLIHESLEKPEYKKSLDFPVSTLKERYEAIPPTILQVDSTNTKEDTVIIEANSLLFFSTPKKSRPITSSRPIQDNELVQLGTGNTPASQPNFEFHSR